MCKISPLNSNDLQLVPGEVPAEEYLGGPDGGGDCVGDVPVVVDGGAQVADPTHQHRGTHVVEPDLHGVNLKMSQMFWASIDYVRIVLAPPLVCKFTEPTSLTSNITFAFPKTYHAKYFLHSRSYSQMTSVEGRGRSICLNFNF